MRESGPVAECSTWYAAIDSADGMAEEAPSLPEEPEADALAASDYPVRCKCHIRISNCRERANCETMRRSMVMRVFPSAEPLVGLMATVMAEQDEDWSSGR